MNNAKEENIATHQQKKNKQKIESFMKKKNKNANFFFKHS